MAHHPIIDKTARMVFGNFLFHNFKILITISYSIKLR